MRKPKPPETFEEVEAYIQKERLNVDAKQFWRYFEAGDWHDKNGKPVLNWKQKLITWHGRDKRTKAKRIERGEIDRYKQRIRDHYEPYLRDKDTQALIDLKKDGGQISKLAGWLIDEILEERTKT
jgi:hypothetical protein